MFLARFSTNLQRKLHLTNAFKNIFRDDSFKLCSKIAGFLGVLGELAHDCARVCASERLRTTRFGTCRVPYHEALVKASGKDLVQGQVALLDPIGLYVGSGVVGSLRGAGFVAQASATNWSPRVQRATWKSTRMGWWC